MKKNVRCDLALEAREMAEKVNGRRSEIPGVSVETEDFSHSIHVSRVHIYDARGEKALLKEQGHYITVEMPARLDEEQAFYETMCTVCARELQGLCQSFLAKAADTVLVVGLGNRNMTADALGPKVIHSLMITRHLKEYIPEEIDERIRPVCAVAPGVLGLTGIETGEIVKGLVDRIHPKLIIAIDALCAQQVRRVNRTIQLSDTGLTPGEGVGNKRPGLNLHTLGVPVIAIGVPTVVEAATIAEDSINHVIRRLRSEAQTAHPLYRFLSELENENKYALIRESTLPDFGDFIVAPKEVDAVVDDLSRVIANGINIALHEGITPSDIDRYR